MSNQNKIRPILDGNGNITYPLTCTEAVVDETGSLSSKLEAIQDQLDNYQPIEITGNVTNAADEEDLTSVNDLLKFKNRNSLNGYGYYILRKGSTIGSQMTLSNTIYEVRYNFDISEENPIEIPSGCILYFNGGSFIGGEIVGNQTYVNRLGDYTIFNQTTRTGTWKSVADINELSLQVSENTSDITNLDTRVSTNTGNISTNTTNISNLTTTVGTNTTDISNLNNSLTTLSNKVSNIADNEDLTMVSNKLKFKDRDTTYGMGKVILRRDQSFKTQIESITGGNTIFVIRYDFTLTDNVTIPPNCVLEFDGGSISGDHTITGNNTDIIAGLVKIFNTDITFAGTWNVLRSYPEWFGVYNNTWAKAIQKAIDIVGIGGTVLFSALEYNLGTLSDGQIVAKSYIRLYSNCYSRLYTQGVCTYSSILGIPGKITIEGLCFDQTEETRNATSSGGASCISAGGYDDYIIRNCKFKHFGNAVQINGLAGSRSIVDNCEFYFFNIMHDSTYYDVSSLHMRSGYNICTNNKIMGDLKNNYYPIGGIELHGHACHCYGNTISGIAGTGIYIVNSIRTDSQYYEDGHNVNHAILVHDNTFRDIFGVAFGIWAQNRYRPTDAPFQDMKDVMICNNYGYNVKQVVSFLRQNNSECNYKDIKIVGNVFSANPTIITNNDSLSIAILCNIFNTLDNCIVEGNIFDGYNSILQCGAAGAPTKVDITFKGNIFKNIFNYTSMPDAVARYALFWISETNHYITIIDNVFEIDKNSKCYPRIFNIPQGGPVVKFYNNKKINLEGYIKNPIFTGTGASRIQTDDIAKPKISNSDSDTFLVGDILVGSTAGSPSIKVCTKTGTNKSSTFTSGKAIRVSVGSIIECNNGAEINVEDPIVFSIDTVAIGRDVVAAKVGNNFYTYNNIYSYYAQGDIGDEHTVNSLTFDTPTLENIVS